MGSTLRASRAGDTVSNPSHLSMFDISGPHHLHDAFEAHVMECYAHMQRRSRAS